MVRVVGAAAMPFVANVTAPIREFFTQRTAERAIVARPAAVQRRVELLAAAGERRLLGGRRVSEPVAAALLLRDAVVQYARAAQVARGAPDDPLDVPPLPADPARPRAEPSDDARLRAALAATDPLYFDALSPEDAERTRWALDRAAALGRRRVDARSIAHVRATRWGRWAALAIVVAWGAFMIARVTVLPRNVALGKPFRASSVRAQGSDDQTITDGDTGTSFALETNIEDSPWIMVDLEGSYWISKIKVYNRVDGWFDDCLPLVAEISTDGKTFAEVGHRDTHFGTRPPWIVDAGGRAARYVRVRGTRHTNLGLSEIEVYGKKQK